MKHLPTFERPYSSPWLWNVLTSPSNSDRWVCIPEPNTPSMGLGMNVVYVPRSVASCFTTRRNGVPAHAGRPVKYAARQVKLDRDGRDRDHGERHRERDQGQRHVQNPLGAAAVEPHGVTLPQDYFITMIRAESRYFWLATFTK